MNTSKLTEYIRYYRSIKIHCYFDEYGMVSWAIKYKGAWYGATEESGLLQYAERAIDILKQGKEPKCWRYKQ